MRSRTLAFGGLFIGSALALLASQQPWWRATGEGVVLSVSGTEATGGLSQALAIVALAGTLLMLALQAGGRRMTGGLLLLVGVGIAVVGVLGLQPSADAVRGRVHEVSLAERFELGVTVWPWAFTAAGAMVAVAAVLTTITAGTWAARSDRFQSAPDKSKVLASDEPVELWKALDAGVDPTDSPRDAGATNNTTDHDTAEAPYPDVHDPDPSATMDGTEGRRGAQ
ncbi:MAG: hypothetical protein K0R13_833 [Propionibacteriaceae bacterium]|jgi:uncharacterized membrane protein (TIGR02234 family)|nr:hypothetical protein [Propionibacteriaceae bacterium]